MVRHAAESFDILASLDENQGVPKRKAAETFLCDCGMTLSVAPLPGAYEDHRKRYHQYCGQCKCEPCQCELYGLR